MSAERTIESIIVGDRVRKDPGDLTALKASIEAVGLLQPVTVTPDNVLLCGFRRLTAMKELGRRTISVHVVAGVSPDLGRLLAERDENVVRDAFTIGQLATLYGQMKRVLTDEAERNRLANLKQNQGDRTADSSARGDVRDRAAHAVGQQSHFTFERILEMRRIAADETYPAELRVLVEQHLADVDATGKVSAPYAETKRAQQQHALAASLSRTDLDPDVRAALTAQLERLTAATGTKQILDRVKETTTGAGTPVMLAPRALADFVSNSISVLDRFDPAEIANEFTDARMDELDLFVQRLTRLRDEVRARRRAS